MGGSKDEQAKEWESKRRKIGSVEFSGYLHVPHDNAHEVDPDDLEQWNDTLNKLLLQVAKKMRTCEETKKLKQKTPGIHITCTPIVWTSSRGDNNPQ